MAVEWVREDWKERSANEAGINNSSRTRIFLAKTTSKLDNQDTILNSGLVPTPFVDFYPGTGTRFICRNVTPTNQSEDSLFWDVVAEYTDEPLSQEEEQQQPNPTLRPVVISWGSAQYQKPLVKDINDEPIDNSAEDPYDPPITIDDARWVISVQQNLTVVPSYILTMNNVINDSPVSVDGIPFAAQTLKVQGLRIGPVQRENNVAFRSVSFQLHFREETWQLEVIDAGFRTLSEKNIKNEEDKEEPTLPVKLNGAGEKLPKGQPTEYNTFDVYTAANIAVLPGVS